MSFQKHISLRTVLNRSFLLGVFMKHTVYRYFSILFSMLIFIISFFSLCSTSYAITPEEFMEGAHSWDEMDTTQKWITIGLFIVAECKAVVTADFVGFLDNDAKFSEYRNAHSPDDFVSDDGEDGRELAIPKELVTIIKQCLDDYAAENQPFKVEKTYRMAQIPASAFGIKPTYEMFKSYFGSSYSYVVCNPQGSYGFIGDLTACIKGGGGFIKNGNYIQVMDGDWKYYRIPVNKYVNGTDADGKPHVEIMENFGVNGYLAHYDAKKTDFTKYGQYAFVVTPDGGNIRVFNTGSDFINYSVGQRKIYYTSNYYDYVPEDLQVSIDELQKTIDDMQDVIDKLLDQIGNDTSESEIEELLRLILEELKNNQGGGGGSGGGDVNVDIDLSSTNSLLSKILAKITQIYDKMNTAVGDAEQAAFTKIQESLDEIVEQLKKIKRWTAIDTVIDGVDAVADWLDLIRGVLKDAKEGAGSAVAALSSAVGGSVDLMSKKFPFSIPWDVLFFVSVLSAEPQMPHFEIPFNIESSMLGITIDYTMELDFSQFQWLSDLSRLIFSMIYAVGLMKMTFGVTSVGKEE